MTTKQGMQKDEWLLWPRFRDEVTVTQTDINTCMKNQKDLFVYLELLYNYDIKCFPCL